MSAYKEVVIERFAGISASDTGDPGAGALTASNVRIDLGDRLRARAGYTLRLAKIAGTYGTALGIGSLSLATATTGPPFWILMFTDRILAVSKATLTLNHTTSNISTSAGTAALSGLTGSFVEAVNTSSQSLLVLGRSDGPLVSYSPDFDALDVSNIGSTFRAKFVSRQPIEGRVVAANAGFGAFNDSRVHFGALPTVTAWWQTFATDDWVDVQPGDGQVIRDVVGWRDRTIVFKDRKFFTFYSTSVDSLGAPVFNYRPVDAGIGCAWDNGAVAARDAVYFIAADGIYKTAGDLPVNVSGGLGRWFQGDSTPYLGLPAKSAVTSMTISAGPDALYVLVNHTSLLVMDLASGGWTIHSYASSPYILSAQSNARSFLFIDSVGNFYEAGDTWTTDNGTAIASSYRFNYTTFGTADRTVVREIVLDGTGTVTVTGSADRATPSTLGSVTLGTDPTAAMGWVRVSTRGRELSYGLSASGTWELDRMILHLR